MSGFPTLWSNLPLPCILHLNSFTVRQVFSSHEELFSWSLCNAVLWKPHHLQSAGCGMVCLVLWRLLGLLPKIVDCWLLFLHKVQSCQLHSQVARSIQQTPWKTGFSTACKGIEAPFMWLQYRKYLQACHILPWSCVRKQVSGSCTLLWRSWPPWPSAGC